MSIMHARIDSCTKIRSRMLNNSYKIAMLGRSSINHNIMKLFLPCCCLLFIISSNVSTTNSITSFPPTNNNGLTLELIHIDHPSSPLYNSTLTQAQRYQRLHEISDRQMQLYRDSTLHVNSFEVKRGTVVNETPAVYWVQLGIGTPPIVNNFKLSTATGVTSIQLQPSNIRYRDMYDPKYSTTSTTVACSDFLCQPPELYCGRDGKHCTYNASVTFDGLIGGPLVKDRIFSSASKFHPRRMESHFDKIAIASFENTKGILTFSPHTAGTLGLGFGEASLPSQISTRSFSYCLSADFKRPSLLRFENEIGIATEGVAFTRLIKRQHSNSYYLNLVGIGINGVQLNIPPTIFKFREETATGGCVIDTGITFTLLVPQAYNVVVREIALYIENRLSSYVKVHKKTKMMGFDLCYTRKRRGMFFSNPMKNLPTMSLYLGTSEFRIPPKNLFVYDSSNRILCLALKSSEESTTTVIGNYQQRDVRITYMRYVNVLQFGLEDCSKD